MTLKFMEDKDFKKTDSYKHFAADMNDLEEKMNVREDALRKYLKKKKKAEEFDKRRKLVIGSYAAAIAIGTGLILGASGWIPVMGVVGILSGKGVADLRKEYLQGDYLKKIEKKYNVKKYTEELKELIAEKKKIEKEISEVYEDYLANPIDEDDIEFEKVESEEIAKDVKDIKDKVKEMSDDDIIDLLNKTTDNNDDELTKEDVVKENKEDVVDKKDPNEKYIRDIQDNKEDVIILGDKHAKEEQPIKVEDVEEAKNVEKAKNTVKQMSDEDVVSILRQYGIIDKIKTMSEEEINEMLQSKTFKVAKEDIVKENKEDVVDKKDPNEKYIRDIQDNKEDVIILGDKHAKEEQPVKVMTDEEVMEMLQNTGYTNESNGRRR